MASQGATAPSQPSTVNFKGGDVRFNSVICRVVSSANAPFVSRAQACRELRAASYKCSEAHHATRDVHCTKHFDAVSAAFVPVNAGFTRISAASLSVQALFERRGASARTRHAEWLASPAEPCAQSERKKRFRQRKAQAANGGKKSSGLW